MEPVQMYMLTHITKDGAITIAHSPASDTRNGPHLTLSWMTDTIRAKLHNLIHHVTQLSDKLAMLTNALLVFADAVMTTLQSPGFPTHVLCSLRTHSLTIKTYANTLAPCPLHCIIVNYTCHTSSSSHVQCPTDYMHITYNSFIGEKIPSPLDAHPDLPNH